jgi:hypothetical protein
MRRAFKIPIVLVLAVLVISTYAGIATMLSGKTGGWAGFVYGFGWCAGYLSLTVFLVGSISLLFWWVGK